MFACSGRLRRTRRNDLSENELCSRRVLLQTGGANSRARIARLRPLPSSLPRSQPRLQRTGLIRRLAARLFVQASGTRDPGGTRQLRRWVSGPGSHESVKIALITAAPHWSSSASFSSSPAPLELVGRGTSTEPTASLTTLPG